nr:hypothetical protein Iba_chr09aCG8390 [Ipomoea batatas]
MRTTVDERRATTPRPPPLDGPAASTARQPRRQCATAQPPPSDDSPAGSRLQSRSPGCPAPPSPQPDAASTSRQPRRHRPAASTGRQPSRQLPPIPQPSASIAPAGRRLIAVNVSNHLPLLMVAKKVVEVMDRPIEMTINEVAESTVDTMHN